MMKHFFRTLPLLSALALITMSCEPKETSTPNQSIDQAKIIVEAIPYEEVQEYVDVIRDLKEYKNNIQDQFKATHIFSFDVRKMTINDSVYYHLELWKTRIARPEESTIPTPEALAYFRILPKTRQILILAPKTKQFIDLADKKGKDCLERCMHETKM